MDPAVKRFAKTVAQQHDHIRTLMQDVPATRGRARQLSWGLFRRYLAAHVAAEQLVMHPLFHSEDREDPVVARRLAEEEEIVLSVTALELLGDVDGEAFAVSFARLAKDLTAHMRLEETSELKGYLHRITDDDAQELNAVLDLVDAVVTAAESPAAVSGSFVAMVQFAELELERLLSPTSRG